MATDLLEGATIGTLPGAIDINVGFTLISGYLVFFMQAGFAMLSAGSVRAKNAKNIILLNLLDACFGCLAWYITGFAFAFGDPEPNADGSYPYTNPFIGHRYFFQHELPRSQYYIWFFQFTFAATAATIVSGAVAERCKFETYIGYNLILVSLVYPVVAHWVWSPMGWMSAYRTPETSVDSSYIRLFGSGVYDFAGDGPVHMIGGFASLAGAYILGARIGRFDSDGTAVDMPGHSASLTLLGVFLLWFGWYGFNPGSSNGIVGPQVGFSSVAAQVAVNTTVAAAAATVSTLFITMLHNYYESRVVVWDLLIAGNGCLAGLVSITGGCAFVETWAAIVIGLIGGILYYVCSQFILHKLRVDDPLDAIAVHAGGGMWGMIGCATFASKELVNNWYPTLPNNEIRPYGFIMGGDGSVLAAHIIYILVIAAWTFAIMVPFFLLFKKLGLMRVPPEVEVMGLDISYHGGHSYPHSIEAQIPATGLNTGAGLSHYTMEEMIDEALRQVEQRGWSPPFGGGKMSSPVDRSRDGSAEEQEPLKQAPSSLDKVRQQMQSMYSKKQPAPVDNDIAVAVVEEESGIDDTAKESVVDDSEGTQQ